MSVFAIPHHYEPALQRLGTAHRVRRHRSSRSLKHLFHQYRTVREVPVFAISGDRARRRINDVELLRALALVGSDCPSPASKMATIAKKYDAGQISDSEFDTEKEEAITDFASQITQRPDLTQVPLSKQVTVLPKQLTCVPTSSGVNCY
jgi:hypothetical protein